MMLQTYSSDQHKLPEIPVRREKTDTDFDVRKTGKIAQDTVSLNSVLNYDSIYAMVKSTVKQFTGRERVGIGLALADLPNSLGAFWEVGGNYIVLNDNLVRAVRVSVQSNEEFNSFVYVILMHEYIHSLGFVEENATRKLTQEICSSVFPESHPVYVLANSDPWEVYPFLKMIPRSGDPAIRFVSKFDSESTSYIA